MMKKLKSIVFALFLLPALWTSAQDNQIPFLNEIRQFQRTDSLETPPKNPIVFVGSSSFRMWQGLRDSFPSHTIVNRGFGGSTLPDVIRFEKETIFKYQPRQVVIYCGENDIASSESITPAMVLERFQKLFKDIRRFDPNVSIAFVSIKPSPSRWSMKDRMIEANELIKTWLQKQKNVVYIDVWESMMGADGKPMADLFIGDNLHMNAKGYELWTRMIRPFLMK